jgi:hypothetical protein
MLGGSDDGVVGFVDGDEEVVEDDYDRRDTTPSSSSQLTSQHRNNINKLSATFRIRFFIRLISKT